jgi:hypothetical protein
LSELSVFNVDRVKSFMRNTDIDALLNWARGNAKSLSMQASFGKIDQIDLKSMLENLRSVLDYLAHDIVSKLKRLAPLDTYPKIIYFPHDEKLEKFEQKVKQYMPILKCDLPLLYELIEEIQPFKAHDNWLVDLCYLTNDVKHSGLSKIDKQIGLSLNYPGIINASRVTGSFSFTGNKTNGKRLDDVVSDGKTVKHTKRDVPMGSVLSLTDSNLGF